jgi:hypothetical protein
MHRITFLYFYIFVVTYAKVSLGRTNTTARSQALPEYLLLTVDPDIITIPTAFPPWSISPSPLFSTPKSHTHPAVIAGSVVGLVLFIVIAVAAFKIVSARRRLSVPRWHVMESRKGRGICACDLPATPISLAYHDTVTAPRSVQNHTLHIAPSEGRKQSESLFPMTPLSKIYNSDSPFDRFRNSGAGDYQRLLSYDT